MLRGHGGGAAVVSPRLVLLAEAALTGFTRTPVLVMAMMQAPLSHDGCNHDVSSIRA